MIKTVNHVNPDTESSQQFPGPERRRGRGAADGCGLLLELMRCSGAG
jgi:hypothetical protein